LNVCSSREKMQQYLIVGGYISKLYLLVVGWMVGRTFDEQKAQQQQHN